MKIKAVHMLYLFLVCCTIIYPSEENKQSQRERDIELRSAAFHGYVDQVRELIRQGANVNFWGIGHGPHITTPPPLASTPLHLACLLSKYRNKKLETIKVLLENGARTDILSSTGKTPLEYAKFAVSYGDVDFYNQAKELLTSSNQKGLS